MTSVTSIGWRVFHQCRLLSSIVIPKGVTDIRWGTFEECEGLTNIVLPDGIKSIERLAFEDCKNLTEIIIPKGVTDIGERAFSTCENLESIRMAEGVISIGNDAFGNCFKLTDIEIPKSVTSIGEDAFGGCNRITSIVIPDGVTNIGKRTFYVCINLTSVTLPASLKEIGVDAFGHCQSLRDIYYTGTEEQGELISIESGNDYLIGVNWQHLHNEVIDPAVEATYFDTGMTEGSHCSACGETIKEQQVVPVKVLGTPAVVAVAGAGNVKLTWKQIAGATGYEIFRSTQQAGGYSKIQTVSGGGAVSFTDTGVSAKTTYYYKVKAIVGVNGKTIYGNDSSVVSSKPLAAVCIIKVSAGKGGKTSGSATKNAGEKVTLKATPDKGYYFAGWKEDDKEVSSSQSYTFKAEKNRKLTASFAKLSAPALTVSSSGVTSIKVSWKKVAGATGYEVYRADSKNGKYTKNATISKSSTVSYINKKLTTGKSYYYKVRAVASGKVKTTYGSYSGVKNVKPAPAKITGVKATAVSKSVKLSWNKAAGVTGYEIYRAASKNGKYKIVKSISKAAATNYTDKKLKANKAYYYKVRTYKTVSGKKVYGDFSAVKSATTKK